MRLRGPADLRTGMSGILRLLRLLGHRDGAGSRGRGGRGVPVPGVGGKPPGEFEGRCYEPVNLDASADAAPVADGD